MAATDDAAQPAKAWGSIVAAALLLPGAAAGQGEPGPGPASVAFKWLHYRDRQPGLDRIEVTAPALLLRLPMGEQWGVEASATLDQVSGASPRWHSAISGASRMTEKREAGDLKVTRYESRSSYALGVAQSKENDFRSHALSVEGRWSTDDNNRSWNAGLALTRDRIGSVDDVSLDERRRTVEVTAGITQALSRHDLVQLSLTLADGRGYYGDPYKRVDQRPGNRRQTITVLRWNHHVEPADLTLRSSYRAYVDSFGVRSHTLQLEPVLALGERFAIAPLLRLYSQSAARFYYDPVYSFAGAPYPPGYFEVPPALLSPDQRLSAFGAVTLGIKVSVRLGSAWSTDLKLERYEQRGAWRIGGAGSPGLAPFSARFVQWGLSRQF